jgi:hypothetical protein
MRRAQAGAAFSSNGNILPLNSDCGPPDPANHASNRSRFLPFGLSSTVEQRKARRPESTIHGISGIDEKKNSSFYGFT